MATDTDTPRQSTPGEVLKNGAKLVGDVAFLPGVSLLTEGNLKSGALHVLGSVVARAVFGPIGWLSVAANAYTKSVTGRGIFDRYTVEKTD